MSEGWYVTRYGSGGAGDGGRGSASSPMHPTVQRDGIRWIASADQTHWFRATDVRVVWIEKQDTDVWHVCALVSGFDQVVHLTSTTGAGDEPLATRELALQRMTGILRGLP